MHDFIVKPRRFKSAILMLITIGVLINFSSQQAFAITGNVSCTSTGGSGLNDLGSLAPSEAIKMTLTGSCKVLRSFPLAGNLSFVQINNTGKSKNFIAKLLSNDDYLSNEGMGATGSTCVPKTCTPLPAGTSFSYEVELSGGASETPGRYIVSVNLYITSIGWENYSDSIHTLILRYTVIQPPCTLSTSKTMDLSFGTLSSNDFASKQQVANVKMNCTKGTQVTATLVPTQKAISGSTGVSATTLDGLSMAATWDDNDTAVTFNSPRALTLKTGANTISLGFRPRLDTNASLTGKFTSQYTLNITYL